MLDNTEMVLTEYEKIVSELTSKEENKDTDGVIFVEKSDTADFKMNYFNKDGTGNALYGKRFEMHI